MVRLLAVLAIVAAFVVSNGGMALAQSNQDLAELVVANVPRILAAEQAAYNAGMAAERHWRQKPLPALPVPPVMTEQGLAQAPNPRPTADFPVARPRPAAKPQQKIPVAEIKRNKGFLDGKAVVVNQENIHVNVMLSASNNLGRNVALEVKTGEYVLLRGTMTGWEPVQQKPVKEVPRGYKVVKGQEVKS